MRRQPARRQPVHKGYIVFFVVLLSLAALATGLFAFARFAFQITEITIEGGSQYSEEVLKDFLFCDRNSENLLLYRYTDRKADPVSIPFIAKIECEIKYPNAIHFVLYDKSIIGYISYMGTYMYFDKDGVIVEASTEKIDGVPHVSGLDFSDIVLYHAMDVSDPGVFAEIQNLTQSLDKYNIYMDEIIYSEERDFSIRVADVTVLLGSEKESFSGKIYELYCLLPELEGRKGTLDMRNFNGDSSFITFVSDEKTQPEP